MPAEAAVVGKVLQYNPYQLVSRKVYTTIAAPLPWAAIVLVAVKG